MDYWKTLEVNEHKSWEDFLKSKNKPRRIFLLQLMVQNLSREADFHEGDGLLWQRRNRCSKKIHDWAQSNRVTIPNYSDGLRSLNLAVSVGIATYEALRQIKS